MSLCATWRLELFFKSPTQLKEQIHFIKDNHIQRINLTNKAKDDKLLQSIQQIRDTLGQHAHICVHWSIKNQYCKNAEQTLENLCSFYETLPAEGVSVLLCSGGGKKKSTDTVQVLKHLVTRPAIRQPGPSSCVCFNPYLPNEKDRQQEQQRLAAKLETGIVAGIYLQMGSDLSKLESGLQHLQAQLQRLPQAGTQPVPIHGSVFIPNKRLLAQQKFRPWSGVFLGEEYLSNVDAAKVITVALLKIYKKHGVVPLVESAIKDTAALRDVIQLFKDVEKQT